MSDSAGSARPRQPRLHFEADAVAAPTPVDGGADTIPADASGPANDDDEPVHRMMSSSLDPTIRRALRLQQQLSDPTIQKALRLQQQLSDPTIQKALNLQRRLLFDPTIQQALRDQRQRPGGALRTVFADAGAVLKDPEFVADLRSAGSPERTGAVAVGMAVAIPSWLAEIQDASATLADPWDDRQVTSWVDALPDLEALRLTVSTCNVLIGVLLLLAALKPEAAQLPVVLAADALLRLADALFDGIDRRNSNDLD